MEIIDELEPTQRGVYTGSIGFIGIDGTVCLNIAIRTVIIRDGKAYAQTGGGIVYDSKPEAEWQETLTKQRHCWKGLRRSMQKVFLNNTIFEADKAFVSARDSGFLYGAGLFETMRSKNGVVFALDDHLDRLFNSSKVLGIPHKYERDYIVDAIGQTLKANELTDARIRLNAHRRADRDGRRKAKGNACNNGDAF